MRTSPGWEAILKAGMLNIDAADARDLMGASSDIPATWCNGHCGMRASNKRGKLVEVGRYANKCPKCQSERLYHDTVGKNEAERFKVRVA